MGDLTPLDIHNKEFKRSFRGYNEDEIDDFLDQVVNDYEKLFRENDNLKEELSRMKKDNAQYQKLENNLKETLLPRWACTSTSHSFLSIITASCTGVRLISSFSLSSASLRVWPGANCSVMMFCRSTR